MKHIKGNGKEEFWLAVQGGDYAGRGVMANEPDI